MSYAANNSINNIAGDIVVTNNDYFNDINESQTGLDGAEIHFQLLIDENSPSNRYNNTATLSSEDLAHILPSITEADKSGCCKQALKFLKSIFCCCCSTDAPESSASTPAEVAPPNEVAPLKLDTAKGLKIALLAVYDRRRHLDMNKHVNACKDLEQIKAQISKNLNSELGAPDSSEDEKKTSIPPMVQSAKTFIANIDTAIYKITIMNWNTKMDGYEIVKDLAFSNLDSIVPFPA